MARTVYIVRHGNTFDKGDIVTRVGARTDLDLSVSGREQARKLGEHFADENIIFSRAICSPLKRTRQTGWAILEAQGRGITLETADFLREIDYGPDENRPEDEVVARIGEDALAAWESDAVPPPGWQVEPNELTDNWASLFDVLAGEASDSPALVVTSNGIARFALKAAKASDSHDLKLKTGAYGIMRIMKGAQPELLSWNMRP